jgi:hypothetical protein
MDALNSLAIEETARAKTADIMVRASTEDDVPARVAGRDSGPKIVRPREPGGIRPRGR